MCGYSSRAALRSAGSLRVRFRSEPWQSSDSRLEIALLWKARGEASSPLVRCAGTFPVAGHLQKMGAHGREAVVVTQRLVERSQQLQSRGWTVDHRERDGPVERDHGAVPDALEDLVDGEDLPPVGLSRAWRLVVDRGDGGLELIRASGFARQ